MRLSPTPRDFAPPLKFNLAIEDRNRPQTGKKMAVAGLLLILRFTFLVWAIVLLPQCTEKQSGDLVQEGIHYTDQENYPKAMASFLLAIEKDPKNSKAYFALGGIYNYQKQHDKAAEVFKKAIDLDPAYYDAHYGLGYTYDLLDKKEEAKEEYQKYKDLKMKLDTLVKMEEASH